LGVSAVDPLDGGRSLPARELKLLRTLISIRLKVVQDPESRRHMNWVSDLISALSLVADRSADSDAALGGYLDETLAFWRRLCETRNLKLSVRGAVPAMPDGLHMPLALALHEVLGEIVRHYDPEVVGQAVAVAFAASRTDISMVVTATTAVRDDPIHAESRAMIEGLVTIMAGQVSWADPQQGGLTLRIQLPVEARRLQ